MKNIQKLVTAAFLFTAFQATAELEFFFAEDVSPWPVSGPNTVPRPSYPRSSEVASRFLARLSGAATESFESYPAGSHPTILTFGTNTATLSGDYSLMTSADTNIAVEGGFPITGTNYFGTGLASRDFLVSFSNPQSAFGFYGMDVEVNRFQIRILRPDSSTEVVPVPVTVPQGSGGVFYVGLIDKARPFTGIWFEALGGAAEGFVYDDMTIAVPEHLHL